MAETARLAYHLHWPLDTILDLEHRDRRHFLAEADALAGLAAKDEYGFEDEDAYAPGGDLPVGEPMGWSQEG